MLLDKGLIALGKDAKMIAADIKSAEWKVMLATLLKQKMTPREALTPRILWAMVNYRSPYTPSRLGNPELDRAKKEAYLRRQARQLGFALTPAEGAVS